MNICWFRSVFPGIVFSWRTVVPLILINLWRAALYLPQKKSIIAQEEMLTTSAGKSHRVKLPREAVAMLALAS
jgi:hypothetical protein